MSPPQILIYYEIILINFENFPIYFEIILIYCEICPIFNEMPCNQEYSKIHKWAILSA